jgi:hypothetical protein
MRRGKETGAWLSILLSSTNGMELSAQEFHDALSMTRYGNTLSNLPARAVMVAMPIPPCSMR